MKRQEYIEGRQATENFEEGMKAIFEVPKDKVVKTERRKKQRAFGFFKGMAIVGVILAHEFQQKENVGFLGEAKLGIGHTLI